MLRPGGTQEIKTTSVTAGLDGTYRFEIDSAGSASLKVSATGFLTKVGEIFTESGKMSPPLVIVGDFALQRGSEISGRVVDTAGTTLSAELNVSWSDFIPPNHTGGKMTTFNSLVCNGIATTEDGFRLFTQPGEVLVTVSALGFATTQKTITAPAEGVEIRLGDGALVEGVVLKFGSRESVSSATVKLVQQDTQWPPRRLTESQAVTDATGAFRFAGLTNETFELSAQGEKLYAWTRPPAISSVTIADSAGKSGLELFVFPGYTMSGRVTEKDTGVPIGGVELTHQSLTNSTAISDAEGKYRLFPVLFGSITARKEGYRVDDAASAQTRLNRSGNSGASTVDILPADQLEFNRDFVMAENITVSGRVTRSNGDLIPGATVSISSSISSGQEDEVKPVKNDGTFSLGALPNTQVHVIASAPGHAKKATEVIAIGDQSVTGIAIVMDAGGTLGGVVVDPDGNPAPDAEVTAMMFVQFKMMGVGENLGISKTDAEGRFAFFNMPPDGTILNAKKEGAIDSGYTSPLTVAEGAIRNDLRLELRKPHFIGGRVVDTNKKPVHGALLEFNGDSSGTGHQAHAYSGEDGRYRVDNLPEAVYQITCVPPTDIPGDPVDKFKVAVDRDNVNFTLGKEDFFKTTTICEVLDHKSRKPIVDFKVSPMQDVVRNKSDKPGEFRVVGKNAQYSLTVSAPGYQPLTQQFSTSMFLPWTKHVEFLLGSGGGTVIGRVVRKSDKSPISGARLMLMAASNGIPNPDDIRETMRNAVSMADGQFVFENAPTGPMQIEVQGGNGTSSALKIVTVEHDKVADTGDIVIGTGD
jgi:protocatechuate 3,4-dioxygenase beta subunit